MRSRWAPFYIFKSFCIILLFLPFLLKAQSNQGQVEDSSAKRFFIKEYQAQRFEKFTQPIIVRGDTLFFDQERILVDSDYPFKSIFTKGLLYPSIIDTRGTSIIGLEELAFLNPSPKQKRFRFWLFRKGFANPQVYFFELTNEKATDKTGLSDFIDGSSLSFLKGAWIVI